MLPVIQVLLISKQKKERIMALTEVLCLVQLPVFYKPDEALYMIPKITKQFQF